MRFKNWLKGAKAKAFVILGSFAMLLGLGASFYSVKAAVENEVVETKAGTSTTVYYACENSENYTIKWNAQFQTNNDKSWYSGEMAYVGNYRGKKVYQGAFDDWHSGLAVLQFQRYDGDTWKDQDQPFSSWTSVSTYNGKLRYGSSWVGASDLKDVAKTSDQSPSSSTGRVFFYNSGTHWASASSCGIYAWGGSASVTLGGLSVPGTLYYLSWFTDDNGDYYGYADIPTDVTGYQFLKLNTSYDVYDFEVNAWGTDTFTMSSVACVCYAAASGMALSTGGAHNDYAGAALMARVIGAYDTCSSSSLNGYGAYSNLNTYFYSHATDTAKASKATSMGGSSMTIEAHFEGMSERASGGSSAHFVPGSASDQSPLTTTLWIVLGAGLLGMGAIGTAYFVSKKKKRQHP